MSILLLYLHLAVLIIVKLYVIVLHYGRMRYSHGILYLWYSLLRSITNYSNSPYVSYLLIGLYVYTRICMYIRPCDYIARFNRPKRKS